MGKHGENLTRPPPPPPPLQMQHRTEIAWCPIECLDQKVLKISQRRDPKSQTHKSHH
ncbi:hypothetical protein YC2023_098004 [Brassica napus]